jgi:hypothetical protein
MINVVRGYEEKVIPIFLAIFFRNGLDGFFDK